VRSEPEHAEVDDEPPAPEPVPVTATDDIPSPMADLPGGAAFGTLVHAIAETADPTAVDLHAELTGRAREQLARHGVTVDAETLARALLPAYDTPLGPLVDGRRLSDFPAADRLAELDFEFPLCGGDEDAPKTVTLSDVGRLLRTHLAPGHRLAHYGELLQAPLLGQHQLRGYLAGSVDAVLRVPGPRYVVVDYKTNRLGTPGVAELTALDYHPDALTTAMSAAHYPLQALLYSVALHRFLRWRQPGYDPHAHLGGVLYLFLRGMCGPATPAFASVPCGVFSWRPPAALVEELSVLLAGGAR
jgi:exodeoxyribonuclease V beta subunit